MRTYTFASRPGFELRVTDDRLDFYADGWELFSFPLSSRVLLVGAAMEDADESVAFECATKDADCVRLCWRADSPAWVEKRYTVRIYPDHVTYEISLSGCAGAPERIEYFRGSKHCPAGRYFTSACLYCQAEDMDYEREKRYTGTDLFLYPGMASPPPFVFPFYNDCNDAVIGLGLAAGAGENTYSRMNLRYKKPQAMWLELPYDKGAVSGETWRTPTVWFGFGREDLAVVRAYADWCRAYFFHPDPSKPEEAPLWWKKPLFCGWLEQSFLAEKSGAAPKDCATQQAYEEMVARMDRVGLHPGIIVIDDKWQKDYGTMEPDTEKWPDLRAFTDRRHAAGQHVLLWWRLWAPDGLPGEACIRDAGVNVAADPTAPAYLRRLEDVIHMLLSSEPGAMNCDGFKLDYIYRLPPENVAGCARERGVAGMELMHRYYEAIYRISKRVKPDALINTSVAHPYFADVFDQIRLHDYNSAQRSTVSMMKFRAAFIRAVFPDALLDTDGANFFTGNSQHILYHNRAAVTVGSPSLYGLDPLTDEELLEIRRVWDAYEANGCRPLTNTK